MPILASELYATTQGDKNRGTEKCHWCGSMAEHGRDLHDEPPLTLPPFSNVVFDTKGKLTGGWRNRFGAIYPDNPWVCRGCFLWRRQRMSVVFLDGSLIDKQCPLNHSWLVTDKRAFGLRLFDKALLYEFLLSPPRTFFLSLLRPQDKVMNLLHRAIVNDFTQPITAGDTVTFTINNTPMTYTPYELEQALRTGLSGKEPGVRALVALLGSHQLPTRSEPKQENRKEGEKGRPPALPSGKELKKHV